MTRNIKICLVSTVFAAAFLSAGAGQAEVLEALDYRWRLGGYKGFLARLIVPGSGDAVLRTTRVDAGRFVHELHITSPKSRHGEFWLYGSAVEGDDCGRVTTAWNQQLFRGREKERRAEIEEDGVLDIPSCICRLRRDPPEDGLVTRIWSDGKVYPIEISRPVAGETLRGGRSVPTHTYTVAGLSRPDEREWKGRLVLVLALDEERTPLEIDLVQPGIAVRLDLAEKP